ncbi:hypothetical protein C922_05448 [Plasmodium inui San Antonio 1]|uniref:SRCR domain-containing protein n=1 Tax=Plasmodium inui San Antonio 1 TaxID=1237626 RepID=W6ZTC0_9APIC|nr:hypothetical protein C922_05448 [Plasmodium inui San Antonio 1]EUD64167.1 hypothetical protein C922_05448 [Plasmodium inui San Antonio 1]
MQKLHSYMLSLEEDSNKNPPGTTEQYTAKRLTDLKNCSGEKVTNVTGRWMSMANGPASIHGWTAQAANIICKNLELWFGNLQETEGSPPKWTYTKCTADNLEVEGSKGTTTACPPNPNHNYWSGLGFSTELSGNKREHRSLMICMDVISILLTVYNNVNNCQNQELCYNNTLVCEALYEWYKEWGGEKVAKEIMKFLFSKGERSVRVRGQEIQIERSPSEFWAKILGIKGLRIAGLQCQATDWPTDNWNMTCLHRSKGDSCQVMGDQAWEEYEVIKTRG